MGRIKSLLVKRTAKKLMAEDSFNDKFDNNKKGLNNLMPSKKVRNKIAGYIARLKRREIDSK